MVGLRKYLFCRLWLQRLFRWFTALNTSFNINIICIVVFTCNVYIYFRPFVGVSTFSVWFLLSISRTKLFKKILTLFRVLCCPLLAWRNLITSSVRLLRWIFRAWIHVRLDPLIFSKCSEKKIKRVVLHVWPNNILSHDITISQFHPFFIWIHFIISPFHHFTIIPLHQWIYIVYSKLTLTPFSLFCVVPWYSYPILSKVSELIQRICSLKQCNCYHVCLSWYNFKRFLMLQ